MRRILIALALVVAAGAAAAEDDDPVAKERARCTDMEGQSDMNVCSAALHKKLDAEMKRAYEALLKRATDKTDKADIRDAQKGWTTYAAKHCKFQASGVAGGSVHPLILNLCFVDLTEMRRKELAYFLTCEDGDLSCPYPTSK